MKFIIFLLFSINLFNAQKLYDFNKEITYNITFNKNKNESVIYINTNDSSYFLKTFKNFAFLYDLKDNRKIYFEMIEIPNSTKYDLKYSKNEKFYPNKLMNYKHYDYVISTHENTEELKIYTNKKRKRIYKIFKYEINDSEIDYFPAFKYNCLHPFEFNQNLKYEKPILVKKSTIQYKENSCECNLKSINDIKFTLKSQ